MKTMAPHAADVPSEADELNWAVQTFVNSKRVAAAEESICIHGLHVEGGRWTVGEWADWEVTVRDRVHVHSCPYQWFLAWLQVAQDLWWCPRPHL